MFLYCAALTGFFTWLLLSYQDSNLGRQNQNLQCYHYTIAQYNYELRTDAASERRFKLV